MARWLFLLGGLLVWGAHFGAVYGVASIAAVAGEADGLWSRLGIGLATIACLGADALLMVWAWRRWEPVMPPGDREVIRLWRTVGGVGAGLSAAAVFWQGLPALLA